MATASVTFTSFSSAITHLNIPSCDPNLSSLNKPTCPLALL